MSLRIQIIIAVAIVIAFLGLTAMIKKEKIEIKYALIWYLLGVVVMIFDLFPGLLDTVSSFMGVELAVNMLFFLGFCFALVIIFILTVWVSSLSHQVKRLTQELALLDKRTQEEIEEKGKE